MRVLLVEDDVRFGRALVAALTRHGYDVEHVTTAAAAAEAGRCDLVLLDLGLPDADGMDLCERLRAGGDVAVIMLTARGQLHERVTGLRSGADDYVVKPFGFAELEARMEAVLRRTRPRVAGTLTVGRLRVDLDRHQAYVDSDPVAMTRKEFELLSVLAARPETAIRREHLLEKVWQTTWRGTSRTLDVHIASLRAKIGAAAEIQTIRGVGYLIAPRPAVSLPVGEER